MRRKLEKLGKPSPLKDGAYEQIKGLILSTDLRAGDMLELDSLASELGISRTPLREALLRLEQERLVETIPYKGTFVARISSKDVEDIYQVREMLEPLAVRLAMQAISEGELKEMRHMLFCAGDDLKKGNLESHFLADTEFHRLIISRCGNEVLQEVLETLADRIYRVRTLSKERSGSHLEQSLHEHCRILDAMSEGDVDKAEHLMAVHIRNAGKRITQLAEVRS